MKSIEEILYKLISIQSDTGTAMEIKVADCIYQMIQEDEYFKQNQDLCGKYLSNDYLERPVVWALKKSKHNSKNTVILAGHYDCVEIECYGELKKYCLNPQELKCQMLKIETNENILQDLNNDNWVFGRGINDMKAGVAINLYKLLDSEYEYTNVLFIAVPDEENMSSGMRQATQILSSLKQKYILDYKLMLLSEPHMGEEKQNFTIYTGSVGKIMPCIVVKGKLGHGSEVMSSLNATYVMSQILSQIELNSELVSKDGSNSTQPPTCLYCRDLKETYDVSVTEYSASYFNYQYLNTKSTEDITKELLDICDNALVKTVEKYNHTFDTMLNNDMIEKDKKVKLEYKVLTFDKLKTLGRQNNTQFDNLLEEYSNKLYDKVKKNEISNIQEVSVKIVKKAIELSNVPGILAVLSYIPPYYPAVKNENMSGYVKTIENILNSKFSKGIDEKDYFMGISDISYTRCENLTLAQAIMSNMVVDKQNYDIDFETICDLNIPSIVVGPLGKDYHTKYERVFIKDVTETVPSIYDGVINYINNN